MELFPGTQSSQDKAAKLRSPLADRMRPREFTEFVGQEEIISEGKPLREIITTGKLPSLIFWGPPGSGKTTLAYLVALATGFEFISFSAVISGIKDIKEVMARAEYNQKSFNKSTILFVDEIHRFNKAQQDAFLPYVEKGTITLIGATTENPSFELISALLSRCRVFVLRALKDEEIGLILKRALSDKTHGLGEIKVAIESEVMDHIINMANGDARTSLNLLEMAVESTSPGAEDVRTITSQTVEDVAQRKVLLYDKAGEEHYNIISALHKSLRGSDPDAALYWLGRMLEAGEDPLYVARRLVRFASEDVGNADPQALVVAMAAKEAVDFVGMPEADLALAQVVVYLATAPKSNSLYAAYGKVKEAVAQTRNDPVPLHLRNPVTSLMAKFGYGQDYKYPHKEPEHFIKEDYLPENLVGQKYYQPGKFGFEKEIQKRLEYWHRLRDQQKT